MCWFSYLSEGSLGQAELHNGVYRYCNHRGQGHSPAQRIRPAWVYITLAGYQRLVIYEWTDEANLEGKTHSSNIHWGSHSLYHWLHLVIWNSQCRWVGWSSASTVCKKPRVYVLYYLQLHHRSYQLLHKSLVVMMRKSGTTVTSCTYNRKCQHITAGGLTHQRPSQQPHSGWQSQTWYTIHWQHSNQSAGTGTLLPVHHTLSDCDTCWAMMSCCLWGWLGDDYIKF